MATAIQKTERTLAEIRLELWQGSDELYQQFLASITEQVELTAEQQETIGNYLSGVVEKRDKLADFIKSLEEEAERLRGREKVMADRRHEFESLAKMFRSSVLTAMQNNPAGIVLRVDGHESSFRVKKNPPRVDVFNEELLPGQFIKYAPVADKTAIKDALDAGQEVPGARIADPSYRLDIR